MTSVKRPDDGVYQVMNSAPSRQPSRAPTVKRSDIRGFHLVPSTVACEGTTTVTIVFDEAPNSSGAGKVEASVRSKEKTDRIEATPINRRTFSFTAPENLSGEVPVIIFVDGTEVASGHLTYRSETALETARLVSGVAQVHVQLLARLCRYLYVLQTNQQIPTLMSDVDKFLAQWFDFKDESDQIEPKFFEELFGILRHSPTTDANAKSPHEFPTLLHLTAEFGFSKLTEKLMDLPEAERASQVRNAHGYTSSAIANNSGHNAMSAILTRRSSSSKASVPAKRTDSGIGACPRGTILPSVAKQFLTMSQALEESDYVKPDSLQEEDADTYGLVTGQRQTDVARSPDRSSAPKPVPPKPSVKSVQLNKLSSDVGKVSRSSFEHPPLPTAPRRESRESRDSGAYVDGTETGLPPPLAPRNPLSRGASQPVEVGHRSPRGSQEFPSSARMSEQDIRRQLQRSVPPQPGSKGPSLTK